MGDWGALLGFCSLIVTTFASFCRLVFQEALVFSPECKEYYTQDAIDKFKALLSKFNLLGK